MEKIHILSHEFNNKKSKVLVSSCAFKRVDISEVCELCLVIFNPQNDGYFSDEETIRLLKKEFECGISDNRTLLQITGAYTYHKDTKIKELTKELESVNQKNKELTRLNERSLWQVLKDKIKR